jgi:alpha-amylase
MISVFTNLGANGGTKSLTLASGDTDFTASQAVTEIGGCTAHTTDGSGNLAVTLTFGLPGIFYPTAQLTGSGVCGL